jgi:hypothetical protein
MDTEDNSNKRLRDSSSAPLPVPSPPTPHAAALHLSSLQQASNDILMEGRREVWEDDDDLDALLEDTDEELSLN